MSIFTLEKPVPNVAVSDWYHNLFKLRESCENYRLNLFKLKNESLKLRNETDITTHWNTHHTNSNFIDRRTEIIRWKNLIEIYYKNVQKEIKKMKNDKEQTEQILEFLNLNFTVTNHCLSIRDERSDRDLCYDIVSVELKNEQHSLEILKKILSELCQTAWEQINKLEELQINVIKDLDNKYNTIDIDTDLLETTKGSKHITLKPDPLRVKQNYIMYETWLQQCNDLKERMDHELVYSKKLRDTIYVPRNKIKDDLRALDDNVNYALRRRIYDTERMKNELEWRKLNLLADKETFLKEIENLEKALDEKLNPKMLVETRCEERLKRLETELCFDKTTIGLHKENVELNCTTTILIEKLIQTKAMYNALTEQINLIDEELKHKIHALSVDRKCLKYRVQLQKRT